MSYLFYNNFPYGYSTFPTMIDHSDPVGHDYFSGLHQEVQNIEYCLGNQVNNAFENVKDRLDYMQALSGGVYNPLIILPLHFVGSDVRFYQTYSRAWSNHATDPTTGYAHLHVPKGLNVVKLVFNSYQVAGVDKVYLKLYRTPKYGDPAEEELMAEVETENEAGDREKETETISFPLIQTPTYRYYLKLTIDPDNTALNCLFYQALIYFEAA